MHDETAEDLVGFLLQYAGIRLIWRLRDNSGQEIAG